jgi:SsrA-binding protein
MEPLINKKARFDYEILETYEGGLVLSGPEVKSIRTGKASIVGSYAKVYGGEAWLIGANINPYQEKNVPSGYDPMRSKKILLKKRELSELIGKTQERGLTLVPLKLYNKGTHIKLELALAKSKKQHDKRERIKERETKRVLNRIVKGR